MRTKDGLKRSKAAQQRDARDKEVADLQHAVDVALRLSELQAQITAQQLAIALTIKVLAARAEEDGEAVELALYAAAEERGEEHGEGDEVAKALRTLHKLVRQALSGTES
jgi:hypothetical protein